MHSYSEREAPSTVSSACVSLLRMQHDTDRAEYIPNCDRLLKTWKSKKCAGFRWKARETEKKYSSLEERVTEV